MTERRSFLGLIGQAAHYTVRRLALFGIAGGMAIALQALVVVVWRTPHGLVLADAIVSPIFVTLVYAFVAADAAADATDEPVSTKLVWERILERAWAVIVIDFIINEVTSAGLIASLSTDSLDLIFGMLVLVLSALLVFADTSATLDNDLTAWSVVPRAFVRSITIAWNRRTFARVLAIFAIEFLVFTVGLGLQGLFAARHLVDAAFWANVPLGAIATPPIAALTVLVYRDATVAPAPSCSG